MFLQLWLQLRMVHTVSMVALFLSEEGPRIVAACSKAQYANKGVTLAITGNRITNQQDNVKVLWTVQYALGQQIVVGYCNGSYTKCAKSVLWNNMGIPSSS